MDSYLGEIRLFAGGYAPEGWNLCDGTTLNISGNEALFSLIGVTYGGNGSNNFKLPDLRGRVPIGQGNGAGLTARGLGQTGGAETVALSQATIPAHTHAFNTLATPATTGTLIADTAVPPATLDYAQGANGVKTYMNNASTSPTTAVLGTGSLTNAGPAQTEAHQNTMPSFVTNYIICIQGIYPDRPN